MLPVLSAVAVATSLAACGDESTGVARDHYLRVAPDISVSAVSIFQSVSVPLWIGGAERTDLNAVIVEGKAATVVVFLEPAPEFDGRTVSVALGVDRGAGTQWRETPITPTGPSALDRPDSFVEFELPADQVSGAISISVAILDPQSPAVPVGTPVASRYPADGGLRALPLGSAPTPVRLVLIPVRYATGGTEYLPDTSPAQIELYRQTLTAAYPAVSWDIVMHEEIYWDRTPFNFRPLNTYVSDLKAAEDDIPQAHYYSLVSPAESFAAYCMPVCVAGESYLVTDARLSDIRVGAGLGFTGLESAWTMVHELGHVFGRGHSGCRVPRDDVEFPYSEGQIGVWGRDPRDGRYYPPSTPDFMGYCTPVWVSDFTWNKLFERLEDLAALGAKSDGDPYRLLHVDLDEGSSRWGAETFVAGRTTAPTIPARFADDDPLSLTDLPIVWQSGRRSASVYVPLDRVPDLVELPGLAPAPVR